MAKPPRKLPPGHSGIRFLVEGEGYIAFEDLAEARHHDDAIVIFEGDYGGTIYLTVPVNRVKCDDAELRQLLLDIDKMCWADPEGVGMFFEKKAVNSGVSGRMGGGKIVDGLWLHPRTEPLGVRSQIEQVLDGKAQGFDPAGRDWKTTRTKPKMP